MPESVKAGKRAKSDSTIERPARKISMIDGYADDAAAESEVFAAEAETGETAEQTEEQTAAQTDAPPQEDSPQTEAGQEDKKE